MCAQVLLPGAPAESLASQAAPLVAAALAGGTAAALALGRTGSGKTWCLSGCRPKHSGAAMHGPRAAIYYAWIHGLRYSHTQHAHGLCSRQA